ncbi:response regulator transcription factor [Kibdelosporangium banguiense]|uniref:response regulator transcription factor n=1 Tax=Kibdelosporangium banguiense TaxID=1365924 RepID=UPI0027DE1160|nr:helix-turn-helix transcriptional regulator [Kibdelosporangium banguiense]
MREHEVLQLLVERLTNNAIANRLHISPRMVEKHAASLIIKTDVADRVELKRVCNIELYWSVNLHRARHRASETGGRRDLTEPPDARQRHEVVQDASAMWVSLLWQAHLIGHQVRQVLVRIVSRGLSTLSWTAGCRRDSGFGRRVPWLLCAADGRHGSGRKLGEFVLPVCA